MDIKTAKIVSYITIIGWLVVFFTTKDKYDDAGLKVHLNQALIAGIAGFIPFIGSLVSLVYAVWGIINACQDNDTPLPLTDKLQIIK